jgi:hypothetical protein
MLDIIGSAGNKAYFAFDINGDKGPNQNGIDRFSLILENEGFVVTDTNLKLIMENGWKIPDNYPFKF